MSSERPMGILQKSSDLIGLLAARGPLTPAEIAEEIGMPRSSVYRFAEALGQIQLAETLPDSRVKVSLRSSCSRRAGARHGSDDLSQRAAWR